MLPLWALVACYRVTFTFTYTVVVWSIETSASHHSWLWRCLLAVRIRHQWYLFGGASRYSGWNSWWCYLWKCTRLCMLCLHPLSVTFLVWRYTHTFEIRGSQSGGAQKLLLQGYDRVTSLKSNIYAIAYSVVCDWILCSAVTKYTLFWEKFVTL